MNVRDEATVIAANVEVVTKSLIDVAPRLVAIKNEMRTFRSAGIWFIGVLILGTSIVQLLSQQQEAVPGVWTTVFKVLLGCSILYVALMIHSFLSLLRNRQELITLAEAVWAQVQKMDSQRQKVESLKERAGAAAVDIDIALRSFDEFAQNREYVLSQLKQFADLSEVLSHVAKQPQSTSGH